MLNAFYASTEMHSLLWLLMWWVRWMNLFIFFTVKPAFHFWNKVCLTMVFNHFYILLALVCFLKKEFLHLSSWEIIIWNFVTVLFWYHEIVAFVEWGGNYSFTFNFITEVAKNLHYFIIKYFIVFNSEGIRVWCMFCV